MLEKRRKKNLAIIIGNRKIINQQDSDVILKTNMWPDYTEDLLVLDFKLRKNVKFREGSEEKYQNVYVVESF